MGTWIKMGVVVIGMLVSGAVDAKPREFKSPDGRTIQAEIIDFNTKTGLVELELPKGKRVKVKPSIFVAEDQTYIKEWAKLSAVRSPTRFKVSAKKNLVKRSKKTEEGYITKTDGSREQEPVSEAKFEEYVYEIYLENRNDIALENVTLEYRIFYEQLRVAGSGAKRSKGIVDKKVVSGTLQVKRLEPKKKTMLTTSALEIHEREYFGDFIYEGGDPIKEKGEIKGIWILIRSKSASGEVVMRDVYEPSSLKGKYRWK